MGVIGRGRSFLDGRARSCVRASAAADARCPQAAAAPAVRSGGGGSGGQLQQRMTIFLRKDHGGCRRFLDGGTWSAQVPTPTLAADISAADPCQSESLLRAARPTLATAAAWAIFPLALHEVRRKHSRSGTPLTLPVFLWHNQCQLEKQHNINPICLALA